MNRKILNKDVQVIENHIVITENVETRLDQNQLEQKLRDIQMQKLRIKEQNSRLVEDYNRILGEEKDINDLILQLNINDVVKEI